jgi:hypothetical protein
MTIVSIDYDKLFFRAQAAVCDEPDDKRMAPMAALRMWACYRDGKNEPGLVSLPITKEPKIKSRPRPARVTAMELSADLNRVICGALPADGSVEVLYTFVVIGSVAGVAAHWRAHGLHLRTMTLFDECKALESAAVGALVKAGYCYPVKRGKGRG